MIRRTLFSFFLLIIILTTNIIFNGADMVIASENNSSDLIEKISRDYTKKFCNSIGFGLSKESAMNFSYSENKQIFAKRKGVENINKDLLANEIANSVINSCGYQLNLFGDKEIKEFANLYLSIDKEN